MLVGRETELAYLQQIYEKSGNQLLIVYGQKNIGKTSLLLQFADPYSHYYFMAGSGSESMHLKMWYEELKEQIAIKEEEEYSFLNLFTNCVSNTDEKVMIIIDEFQLLVKSGNRFLMELNTFLEQLKNNTMNRAMSDTMHNTMHNKEVMIVLASSSIGWVENTMVSKMGKAAFQITGLYKLKELSITHIQKMFPTYSLKDCLAIYGVAGGVPGILEQMDPNLSVDDNICNVFLKANSFGRLYGEFMLLDDLRETTVYNTILETIASGKEKLNDIYGETSYSRAKISVYIKNLIQLELVEKVFSYDTEGRNNTKKGIYRIQNKFASFWYTYVFPNLGKLELSEPITVYENSIKPGFLHFLKHAFKELCESYISNLKNVGRISFTPVKSGEWIGKTGIIDFMMEDEEGQFLTAFCKCENALFTYEDLEWNLFSIENARLDPVMIYFFSMNGFDERTILESKKRDNLVLVTMADIKNV